MEKAKSFIGLAARAGRIAVGAQAVETAVRGGNACLVILDSLSSDNSQKKYMDMCRHYQVSCYLMEDPCQVAGKPGRMCIAVCDAGLAEQIEKELLREQNSGGRG